MKMTDEDLERKLKLERVEACLNCKQFAQCENIGKFVECEEFVELEREKAKIVMRLDEYAKLEAEDSS